MGLESIVGDLAKDIAIGMGKELVSLGVKKLGEYLTPDEVHETVGEILPEMSASRKAQREIEASTKGRP